MSGTNEPKAATLLGSGDHLKTGPDHSHQIRDLNDAMRKTLPFVDNHGQLIITDSVAQLHIERLTELLLSIRDFAEFDAANDPWREHDFGMVEVGQDRFYWKIDYYDRSLRYGSDDPTDSARTVRILTVMRADEY